MRLRRRNSTKQEANQLSGHPGRTVIVSDTHDIRLYDGTTPGGYVIPTSKVESPNGPGPSILQAGSFDQGFYGTLTNDEFINEDDLRLAVGITQGESHLGSFASGWLKMSYLQKTLFVSKGIVSRSWAGNNIQVVDLINAGVLKGGDTAPVVEIDGFSFKVRSLTGGNGNPSTGPGGEWNALMYPVHIDDPDNLGWGINLTDRELDIGPIDDVSVYTTCQEVADSLYVRRGFDGITSYTESGYAGWRPVLELVG